MSVSNNIAQKNYKKLIIKVSLDAFSYAVLDLLQNTIIETKKFTFIERQKNEKIEDILWKYFLDEMALTKTYDEIVILHYNNLNTFVPKALFDEDYKGSYLQYNTKVFETDFFAFDTIEPYEMVNVYVPYVNLNNFFIDQFGSFTYKHASSILVSKLLELSKNNEKQTIFCHISTTTFEIVAIQNQKLLLYNSFEYTTPEDFLYYLLFTAEQLFLNPEYFQLYLLGTITEVDAIYTKAYQYIRYVSLLDSSYFPKNNSLNSQENLRNFILFQG